MPLSGSSFQLWVSPRTPPPRSSFNNKLPCYSSVTQIITVVLVIFLTSFEAVLKALTLSVIRVTSHADIQICKTIAGMNLITDLQSFLRIWFGLLSKWRGIHKLFGPVLSLYKQWTGRINPGMIKWWAIRRSNTGIVWKNNRGVKQTF